MRPVSDHHPWFTTDLTQGYPHRITDHGVARYVVRFPKTWERAGEKFETTVGGPNGEPVPIKIQNYRVLTWEEVELAVAGKP